MHAPNGGDELVASLRAGYGQRVAALRVGFDEDGDGAAAVRERAAAVDGLLGALWAQQVAATPRLAAGVCVVAIGGYGRGQLFPYSDIDLLLVTEKTPSADVAAAIRAFSQGLWDCGLRVAVSTRPLGECERFKATDPEGGLALLDLRQVAGDAALFAAVETKLHAKRSAREARNLAAAAAELTRHRHGRFGYTVFHLEPNVKDAPGGLRDTHVVGWLRGLRQAGAAEETGGEAAFSEAVAYLTAVRVFLHYRHGRDDNTLDWHEQDEAAKAFVGMPRREPTGAAGPDAAYWMRLYFRHARAVERALQQELDLSGQQAKPPKLALRAKAPPRSGFVVDDGLLSFKSARVDLDPAADPEIVLDAFGLMAETGVRLGTASEDRLAVAIPALSAALEDGPALWARLRRILCGRYAAEAMRHMHALGLLELLVPEFHGIDALVIRDAYHRYTVDEHTFVLLEALHALEDEPAAGAPEWRLRFRSILRELPHPELLYLAALLHDTGKGRSTSDHAAASAQLAETLCARLDLEPFDRSLVGRLIAMHLEMSAALRRDIFDAETVRVFADKIGTHDLLRMLTLFTYADISAVHPDALTPWKAENLWRLSMAAENQLDRSVDEDRVHGELPSSQREASSIARTLRLNAADQAKLQRFLEGVPERYLRTRAPETIRKHMQVAVAGAPSAVLLQVGSVDHELTVITHDRPRLFADVAAGLAGWGMNIVAAEAFSNAHGTVLDTFRFTDPYQTLVLNPEERERFRSSLEAIASGAVPIDTLLNSRRRPPRAKPRREIETLIEFDNMSSPASTLMQVVAQDEPGLLRATSLVLNDFGCSIEVALVDTEGEMAIDVFYLTMDGEKLNELAQLELRTKLTQQLEQYRSNH